MKTSRTLKSKGNRISIHERVEKVGQQDRGISKCEKSNTVTIPGDVHDSQGQQQILLIISNSNADAEHSHVYCRLQNCRTARLCLAGFLSLSKIA